MTLAIVYLLVAALIAIARLNDKESAMTTAARALLWPVALLVALRDEAMRLTA